MSTGEAGVSILVATYNGAAYIEAQLESILAQAAADDEIVIVDDGSSDATPRILTTYAAKVASIRLVVNQRNLGVRRTIERLLTLATRDILFLSDQDDIWIEGRKAAMVAALQQRGCSAVLSNALILTQAGVGGPFFPPEAPPPVGSMWRNYVRNSYIGCCMAFRREVLSVALPFPATISMHDWWIGSCAMAAGRVCYLPAPSLLYRRHASNHSPGTRRGWRAVLRDRRGNLLALATLLHRRLRRRLG